MPARNQAKTIGLFVIFSLALGLLGILVFSSDSLFKRPIPVHMTFTGSTKGLGVGSHITFRGVRLGTVNQIAIRQVDEAPDQLCIHVMGEILYRDNIGYERKDALMRLIESGLKARLETESLVTGSLQVQLELVPDGEDFVQPAPKGYINIPTIPSKQQELEASLKQVLMTVKGAPLAKIARDLAEVVGSINELLNSEETRIMRENVDATTSNIRILTDELKAHQATIQAELDATFEGFNRMTGGINQAALSADELIREMEARLANVDELVGKTTRMVETAEAMMTEGSPLQLQLSSALRSVEASSRQLRQLAETLQRNPESILKGVN